MNESLVYQYQQPQNGLLQFQSPGFQLPGIGVEIGAPGGLGTVPGDAVNQQPPTSGTGSVDTWISRLLTIGSGAADIFTTVRGAQAPIVVAGQQPSPQVPLYQEGQPLGSGFSLNMNTVLMVGGVGLLIFAIAKRRKPDG